MYCCSLVLANMFAHYVLDQWIEKEVKLRCKGRVRLFRFCDDAVICYQLESDALRLKEVLGKRLAKYKLKLNEEKTKMDNFRKNAGNKSSFDFLGFTHYLEQSQKGRIIPKLKTIGKRLRTKLKRANEWTRSIRSSLKSRNIWRLFCLKLRGHINYYGVSHNGKQAEAFVCHVSRIMFKWLNRRSQRRSFNWEDFNRYMEKYPVPRVKVYHKLF